MTERDTRIPLAPFKRVGIEMQELLNRLWCSDCDVPYGAGMFSDVDIIKLVERGRIKFDPMPDLSFSSKDSDLGTCKVDLHLGREALVADPTKVKYLDLAEPIPEEYFTKFNIQNRSELIIKPGQVIIASTLEKVTLADDIYGRMEGKSGVARKGGAVQLAAVFDAGWDGYPMMELHNITDTTLVAHFGNPICAMSFGHLSSKTLMPYNLRNATYSVQDSPTA